MTQAALAGVKVLDLAKRPAAAWCSRLLADYGATVFYLEPHGLQSLHSPDLQDPQNLWARYLLANKSPLDTPLSNIVGKLDAFDVVLDDFVSDSSARQQLPLQAFAETQIHCVITDHGHEGELANCPGNDLTAYARSGWSSLNGLKGRPPLKGPGLQASYQTGTLAAASILCALIERAATMLGQRIDVAEYEVLAFTLAPALLRAAYTGVNLEQRNEVDFTTGPVPCKDGFFALTPSRPHFWIEAMRLLGLPELADHPEMQQPFSRNQHRDVFVPKVHAALLQFDRASLFRELGKRRVIAGPVLTMADLATNEHLKARHYFVDYEGVPFPGAPFRMSRTPFHLASTKATTSSSPLERHEPHRPYPSANRKTPPPNIVSSRGPLSGYRGIVLTQAWAGTLATELLGLMGADIIQVEPFTRMDSWRGPYEAPLLPVFRQQPLQQNSSARHAWNCNPLFNSVNLNKRSVTLDLSKPQGREIFKDLVKHADFVAENFAPRVMGNLGLGYENLRAIKDDIILLSSSGYGASGPWSEVPAIGGTIEPSSGMSSLLGYPGEGPQNSGQMYPDAVAGLLCFYALSLALHHHTRTGEGQYIDLSMQEANLSFIGDFWLQYATSGEVPAALGNRHPSYAPHGIFRAQDEGANVRWVALATPSEAAFRSLCTLANRQDWQTRWPDAAARMAEIEAVEMQIEGWTRTQNAQALERLFAHTEVIVAAVAQPLDVLANKTLQSRGILGPMFHAETGFHLQPLVPCLFSRTPIEATRAAPLHGQHTEEVLMSLLGMSRAQIITLAADGVLTLGNQHRPQKAQSDD